MTELDGSLERVDQAVLVDAGARDRDVRGAVINDEVVSNFDEGLREHDVHTVDEIRVIELWNETHLDFIRRLGCERWGMRYI